MKHPSTKFRLSVIAAVTAMIGLCSVGVNAAVPYAGSLSYTVSPAIEESEGFNIGLQLNDSDAHQMLVIFDFQLATESREIAEVTGPTVTKFMRYDKLNGRSHNSVTFTLVLDDSAYVLSGPITNSSEFYQINEPVLKQFVKSTAAAPSISPELAAPSSPVPSTPATTKTTTPATTTSPQSASTTQSTNAPPTLADVPKEAKQNVVLDQTGDTLIFVKLGAVVGCLVAFLMVTGKRRKSRT